MSTTQSTERSARALETALEARRKKLFRRADRFGVGLAALEFWLLPGSNLNCHVWNGNSRFARGSNGEIARKDAPGGDGTRCHVLRRSGRIDRDWRPY